MAAALHDADDAREVLELQNLFLRETSLPQSAYSKLSTVQEAREKGNQVRRAPT